MGQEQIARLLNVDHTTVRNWLIKAGLSTKLPPAPEISDPDVDAQIDAYIRRKRRGPSLERLKRAAE